MNTLIVPKSLIRKVETKEQLRESLNDYFGILDIRMLDYLNSLIELEFSVIRKNICDKDRKALSELEIYKKVAIYNIYNRAFNMFKESNLDLNINDNSNNYAGLKISANIEDESVPLFNFNYKRNIKSNIDKIDDIGKISLYMVKDNLRQLQYDFDKISKKLERKKNEKNPYGNPDESKIMPVTYGNPYSNFEFNRENKIKELEKIKSNLEMRLSNNRPLTDIEKRKIEITQDFYGKLMKDYDLFESDFKKEESNNDDLTLKLVKNMPYLKLESNISNII